MVTNVASPGPGPKPAVGIEPDERPRFTLADTRAAKALKPPVGQASAAYFLRGSWFGRGSAYR